MALALNRVKVITLKTFIHLGAFGLLAYQYYLAIIDQLGGDPVEAIIHFTGIGAFNLLLLTLLISIGAKKLKQPWLMQVRRLLGLYTFVYALCHVLNFWSFEIQFNIELFFEEIFNRPYITVGLAAFLILLPLAITSWTSIQRKMGRRWQQLHSGVYLALVLIAIHFYWSVKSELIEPTIYIVMSLTLLWLKRDKIKRWLKR